MIDRSIEPRADAPAIRSRFVGPVSRRGQLRRSVQLACQVVRERDFRQVARWIVDLSPEGLLVPAEWPVLTGQPLILSFRAPLSGAWIDAEVVVARVIHGRRPGDRGLGLGLWFEHLAPGDRERLASEVAWFARARTHPRAA